LCALVVCVVGAALPAHAVDVAVAVRITDISGDYNDGKPLPLRLPARISARALADGIRVGQNKYWLALDDAKGEIYLKRFELRGVGDHVEVWVANDADTTSTGTQFPAGDCRNDERVNVTDRQVKRLIREFDENIYPKESKFFSRPRPRDGSKARLDEQIGVREDYWAGPGRRIVTLIDNVRDENFYDFNNSQNHSYIAGFFYSDFNGYHDRNVMTIDSFDWLHRSGANPPNEPVPGDECQSAVARPFMYEAVFAHEYQHLLEGYQDSNETTWMNEGLSNWAQTLTRYVDPRVTPDRTGFDSHIWSFLGWLGAETPTNPIARAGGPENSLTVWGDQGDDEILSDYGAAYTFVELLASRYGKELMTRLHRDDRNGFSGLRGSLRRVGVTKGPREIVREWLAAVALDGVLGDGAVLHGARPGAYRVKTLDSFVNWSSPDAYSFPGAPPNGADFVRLRASDGRFLNASQISSISFEGGKGVGVRPVEWRVDPNPPGHAGDAALHSGAGPNFDRAITREIDVPTTNPTLTFETRYEMEEKWDFGFVQVSTNNGLSWQSLANANTRSDHDPSAATLVQRNVPGFTGTSGCAAGSQIEGSCPGPTWTTQSFDLSDYAGQRIWLAFRYVTDPEIDLAGWWIDDVAVGGQLVSSGDDLSAWTTPSAINPDPVKGWTVQLVAYDAAHANAWLYRLPLDGDFRGSLSEPDIATALGANAETVGAIVSFEDPSESIRDYAPYSLIVNGVEQPGG